MNVSPSAMTAFEMQETYIAISKEIRERLVKYCPEMMGVDNIPLRSSLSILISIERAVDRQKASL